MSRLLLIGLLVTMAIAGVRAKCEIGFFCDNAEKREALPAEEESYLHDGMQMSKLKHFKMRLARNRAMARFFDKGYKFLNKENDY